MSRDRHIWNDFEIEFLKKHIDKLTTKDIAQHLDVSYDQVRNLIRKLNINRSEKTIRRLQRIGGHNSKRSK